MNDQTSRHDALHVSLADLRLRSLGPGQVEACSQPFAPGHLPGPAAVDCAAHYEAIADPRLELGVP